LEKSLSRAALRVKFMVFFLPSRATDGKAPTKRKESNLKSCERSPLIAFHETENKRSLPNVQHSDS